MEKNVGILLHSKRANSKRVFYVMNVFNEWQDFNGSVSLPVAIGLSLKTLRKVST